MGWGVGRFMVLVGMVLFLHSGYSTTHCEAAAQRHCIAAACAGGPGRCTAQQGPRQVATRK